MILRASNPVNLASVNRGVRVKNVWFSVLAMLLVVFAKPFSAGADMQLAIDALDASGEVIGTTSTWVLGGVPPGNRAYFSTHIVPAASYRVQVLFFDWGKGGGQ